MKEKVSTASFSDYHADIDEAYQDVRGNIEQATDHLPLRKNLFTVEDFLKPAAEEQSAYDIADNARPMVEEPEQSPEVVRESRSKRLLRGLGKAALLPVTAMRKVNELSAYTSLEVMSRLPMFKSREEIVEARQARIDKYTAREGDNGWTRLNKCIGRNAVKASAWSMTGVTAAIAASPLLRPITEIPTIHANIAEIADVTVLIGGRGDPTGNGAEKMLTGTGLLTGQVKKVHYPAGVSPLLGDPATYNQSSRTGGAELTRIIDETRKKNPNGTIDVVAFSGGNGAADVAENGIRSKNGGELWSGMRSIRVGNPAAADTGVLQNPMVKGVAGVFDITPQTPTNGNNTINISNAKDLYGNGVNPSLDKVIGSLAGKDHDYSPATVNGASATTTRTGNGATSIILGEGKRATTPNGRSAMMTEVDKVAPAGKKPGSTQIYPQPTGKKPAPAAAQYQAAARRQEVTLPAGNRRTAPAPVHNAVPRPAAPTSNQAFLQQIHAQRNRAPRAA